jgi:C4-dicarboxylate-specific signal transduction histidine kinase
MFTNTVEKKVPLDLNETVRQVFSLLRSELQKNDVIVSLKLTDALPHVMADEVQLQQVILNLAVNAIDALSSVADRPRTLRVKSDRSDASGLTVMLEDSGAGIDPNNVDRIFEPFFTTKANGMGMGLSICRSIVEAHGGRLTVSPAHPQGSAFIINLPASA